MAKVKTGSVRRKRRKRILKHSKGYRGGISMVPANLSLTSKFEAFGCPLMRFHFRQFKYPSITSN